MCEKREGVNQLDMNQYLDVFIDESKEHLQTCNEKLLLLEKDPADLQLVHDIFRAAHTLKGMSATMGYTDLAHLTHLMENVLDAIRNGEMPVTSDWLDVLFEALIILKRWCSPLLTEETANVIFLK